MAKNISTDIMQLHTSEYKNADQLSDGTVLVVGGAQSGCQIAEDLLHAGRKVYLSTSMVGRIPRWYRGRDIFYWVTETKFYDIKAEEIEYPKMLELRHRDYRPVAERQYEFTILSKRSYYFG
jgi:putative flavoprotein involved in K+ transport